MSCLCNPITINTFVVFVRLYWFEKRFRHIVMEAQNFRRNRSISKVATIHREDPHEPHRLEGGMGNGLFSRRSSMARSAPNQHPHEANAITSPDKDKDKEPSSSGQGTFKRDIVFADELPGKSKPPRRLSNRDRVPEQRPQEHHIAFVENQ